MHSFQQQIPQLSFTAFMDISFFLVHILLLSPSFTSSTIHTLNKGSSLSVEKPDDLLISSNGVFSAGFFPVGINAYCFAIWFTKLSSYHGNHTLVWMANRDHPVNGRRSKLSLLETSNLVLTDAGQFIVWSTETHSEHSSVHLQLHNNGNLVLHLYEQVGLGLGVILWQSFDFPTDTLLPQQPLTRYTNLVSSRSSTNFSSGYYKLLFDNENVLELVFDSPETSSIYWPEPWLLRNQANRSRYNDTRIAVFDAAGHFRSSDRAEFRAADFGEGPQRRLTLDFDGNLRLYSLEESKGTWFVTWQAMSKPCRIHGACGVNSICSYDMGSGRRCSCPPSYKMKNHRDWTDGCEPEINLSGNSRDATFVRLPQVDFYGYNINILRNFTLERCERRCLSLSYCRAFQYRFNVVNSVYDCYPKQALRNGHSSPNLRGAMYLKLPKAAVISATSNKEFEMQCSGLVTKQLHRAYKKKSENVALKILLLVASVLGCIEVMSIFLVSCYLYRSSQNSKAEMQGYSVIAATGCRRFSLAEMKRATRGFSEEIGRGGGGVVYRGVFPDARVAAVKRLDEAKQGEEEFLAEVSTIGRLNHMNLIEIWGYCAEGKHRLLVYEYMEHGSLAENLWSNNALDWEKRFEIAVGTAKGLAYLHEECLEWVLHCDVKPQNILLDLQYRPKLADFGLSKLINREGGGGGGGGGGSNSSSFSRVRGTRGYMAPEWVFNLPITSKVDVYSYGIVVLEMVTGRKPYNSGNGGEAEHQRLVTWVREKIDSKTFMVNEIMDPTLDGDCSIGKMETLVGVALKCVEDDRDARPTMSQVVEMLTGPHND